VHRIKLTLSADLHIKNAERNAWYWWLSKSYGWVVAFTSYNNLFRANP